MLGPWLNPHPAVLQPDVFGHESQSEPDPDSRIIPGAFVRAARATCEPLEDGLLVLPQGHAGAAGSSTHHPNYVPGPCKSYLFDPSVMPLGV